MSPDDALDEPQEPTAMPIFKKRNAKANVRKRPAPPIESDSDEEFSSQDEFGQRVVKRRKKGGVSVTVASVSKPASHSRDPAPTADRSTVIEKSEDATKQSNWYDSGEEKDRSFSKTTREKPEVTNKSAGPDGTYKGLKNYSDFIQRDPNKQVDKFKSVGPIKAHSTNVRTVTITDYAPDVCKDYKLTGFCGFGDSCKFLHARDDYKQGWALDRDWEIKTGGKQQEGTVVSSRDGTTVGDGKDNDETALLEKIPFACIICKGPYKNPIVTRCEHYFCQKCAMQRYRRDPTCAACGAGTNGVFNVAKQLSRLLDKKKEREEKLRAKEAANMDSIGAA